MLWLQRLEEQVKQGRGIELREFVFAEAFVPVSATGAYGTWRHQSPRKSLRASADARTEP